MSERWSMVQRVRFGDLDAMQHLNTVEFLRFFETARIEFITTLFPEHKPGARQRTTRAPDRGKHQPCHLSQVCREQPYRDREQRSDVALDVPE